MTDKHDVVESALKLLYGFRSTQVTHVVAKLGRADKLADGPLTAIDLASRVNVRPDRRGRHHVRHAARDFSSSRVVS
ncbi:MAG: hypothetical protein E6J05_01530 [Chloroflexi bacterium]|nr:MAG: hypothetical protein E6J05_01530 [Chloroflexota bacterium]